MTDTLAAARARRVSALFARYGEAVSVTFSGASRTYLGVFAPMDGQTIGAYFDGNESVGLAHPALMFYADGADPNPPVANSLFNRDGRLWTIRKTHLFRLVNTPMLVLALCD